MGSLASRFGISSPRKAQRRLARILTVMLLLQWMKNDMIHWSCQPSFCLAAFHLNAGSLTLIFLPSLFHETHTGPLGGECEADDVFEAALLQMPRQEDIKGHLSFLNRPFPCRRDADSSVLSFDNDNL